MGDIAIIFRVCLDLNGENMKFLRDILNVEILRSGGFFEWRKNAKFFNEIKENLFIGIFYVPQFRRLTF